MWRLIPALDSGTYPQANRFLLPAICLLFPAGHHSGSTRPEIGSLVLIRGRGCSCFNSNSILECEPDRSAGCEGTTDEVGETAKHRCNVSPAGDSGWVARTRTAP